MASSLPAFTNVRLALPADIKRMGSVTIAAFHKSQSFAWIQSHYAEHELDALRAQRQTYKETMMRATNQVLLVVEDEYNPKENSFCPDIITSEENETIPQAGDKVVVGVAMFELPESSARIGDFQNTKAMEIDLPESGNKHLNVLHNIKWTCKESAVIGEHFPNDLYLSLLVVHPAYERRGHGADLINWGIQLANMDRMNMGLIASEIANTLYKRQGFEFVEKFDLAGDEMSPRGIHYEALKFVSEHKDNDKDKYEETDSPSFVLGDDE